MNVVEHPVMRQAMQPARSRTDLFLARIDAHLRSLPPADRAAFIDDQIERWTDLYTAWAARIDAGTATDRDLTYSAWDFQFTLAGLHARAGTHGEAA